MKTSADSRRRAGSGVRARMRAEALAALRKSWGIVVVFLLGYLLLIAAMVAGTRFLGGSDLVVGFNSGVLVGLLGFFGQGFLVALGLSHRSMGAEAETWTALELRHLEAKRWSVLHHVPVPGRGDVDHVAIGPGRLYAIETKWSARSDVDRFVTGAAAQAERQARSLVSLLRVRGLETDVIPLLVIWGPGMAKHVGEKPTMRGETRVVAGAHASTWLEKMDAAAVGTEVDEAARAAIVDMIGEAERSGLVQKASAGRWRRRPEVASGRH